MNEKKLNIGKCIGLIVAAYVMREIGSLIGGIIVNIIWGNSSAVGYIGEVICGSAGDILMAVLLVIAGRKYILTHNISKFGKGLLVGLFSIGFSFYALGMNIGSAVAQKMSLKPGPDALWFTIAMIVAPGIGEELLFRGCIMNFIRDAAGRNTKKGLYISMIGSSLLFGSIHLLNIGMVDTKIALFQTVMAAFMGLYLSAVYARTNCLWVTIFLHFLNDFCAMFTASFLSTSNIGDSINSSMASVNILGAALNIILFTTASVFLMRKKKINECFEESEESINIEMTNAVYAN